MNSSNYIKIICDLYILQGMTLWTLKDSTKLKNYEN